MPYTMTEHVGEEKETLEHKHTYGNTEEVNRGERRHYT